MIKSSHKNLRGKLKIKRKPRPVGNEMKTVCDGRSKIMTFMELYEGADRIQDKAFVQQFVATTATTLRLTDPWKGSGRIVVADSWFGSVKMATQHYNINGLYCIALVKTSHKIIPV